MPDWVRSFNIGMAGELRVMSELILRGYNPAKSYLDNGIDLILEDGIKIQVKTTESKRWNRQWAYRFLISKGEERRRIRLVDKIDFLIAYIIPDNCFFIIPAEEIGDKKNLLIRPTESCKWFKYKGKWDLLKRRNE